MRYIIDILINNEHKMSYKIGAKNKKQAIEKLFYNFTQQQREMISVDSIIKHPSCL